MIFVKKPFKEYSLLDDLSTFSERLKVVLLIEREDKRLEDLKLSKKALNGIAYFLKNHHGKYDLGYDCRALCNSIANIPHHDFDEINDYWDMGVDNEALEKPGTIVYFQTLTPLEDGGTEIHFHHAALCIDKNLYLSVWGAGGELTVTTAQEIIKFCKPTGAYTMTLKNPN